jgi:uncharacterized membrane protein
MYLDHYKKMDVSILKNDIRHPIVERTPTMTPFENTAVYPPAAYLPQAAAVAVTNLFTESVLIQLYAARLAVLVTWLILIYAAIRILPFGKWVAVALSLTPQVLLLAASVSGDAATIGLSLLIVGLLVRSVLRPNPISRREVIVILLTALALSLCKAPYFLLVGLCLAIPSRRFSGRWAKVLFVAGAFTITLIAALSWQAYVRDIFINVFPGSDNALQISYIVHQPLAAASVILSTLLLQPVGSDLLVEMVGLKAWVDAHTPLWLVMTSYAAVLLFCLWEPLAVKSDTNLSPRTRILSLAIAAGGILAVAVLLYISFTPVAKTDVVLGLQGRYFIPFAFLAIPALANRHLIPTSLGAAKLQTTSLLMVVIVAGSVLPLVISRYYLG